MPNCVSDSNWPLFPPPFQLFIHVKLSLQDTSHCTSLCFQPSEQCQKPWAPRSPDERCISSLLFIQIQNFPILMPATTKFSHLVKDPALPTCVADICSKGAVLGLPYCPQCIHEILKNWANLSTAT